MSAVVTQAAELLPCPFCGREAGHGHIRYSRPLDDTTWADGSPITEAFYVNCVWCGAVSRSGIVGGYQTQAEAITAWNKRHRTEATAELVEALGEAREILSLLSSYLGAGLGDDGTTLAQFDERIRWGIDHIGSVYRHRAAEVVEECSKRPQTTWGQVKRSILDDTCLPTASLSRVRGEQK